MTNVRFSKITDELLSAYLDDEVTAEERGWIEEAIAADATMAWRLNSLLHTVQLLRNLPAVAMPRSFVLSPEEATQEMAAAPEPVRTNSGQTARGGLWAAVRRWWGSGSPLLRNAATVSLALLVVLLSTPRFLPLGRTGAPAPMAAAPAGALPPEGANQESAPAASETEGPVGESAAAEESSAAESSAAESSAAESSAAESSATESNATESNATESSATESSATESSATESSATESSATESNATESNAAETEALAPPPAAAKAAAPPAPGAEDSSVAGAEAACSVSGPSCDGATGGQGDSLAGMGLAVMPPSSGPADPLGEAAAAGSAGAPELRTVAPNAMPVPDTPPMAAAAAAPAASDAVESSAVESVLAVEPAAKQPSPAAGATASADATALLAEQAIVAATATPLPAATANPDVVSEAVDMTAVAPESVATEPAEPVVLAGNEAGQSSSEAVAAVAVAPIGETPGWVVAGLWVATVATFLFGALWWRSRRS